MELENVVDASEPEDSRAPIRAEVVRGLTSAFPVMLGFVPFALVLGAQASRKGLASTEVSLMTGLNFGGGSEFAAVHLWSWPPDVLLIVAITLLINSRHLLMGAALAPFLGHLSKKKAFLALFFMCDESWAMGLADARRRAMEGKAVAFSLPYYMGSAVGLYVTWVAFTFIGARLGPVMGNLESYGFDMAFPAVFFVLLAGMWSGPRAARPWVVSLIAGVLACMFLPGAWYVAVGSVAGALSACYWGGGGE